MEEYLVEEDADSSDSNAADNSSAAVMIFAVIDISADNMLDALNALRATVFHHGNSPTANFKIIPYRDIAAVVGSIDPQTLEQEGEKRWQEKVEQYQRVNLHLLSQHVIVPMQFGFIASDKTHVEAVLEKLYLQLRTLLNKLQGKVELVIQTSWNLKKNLLEIAAQEGLRDAFVVGGETPDVSRLGVQAVESIGKKLFEKAEIKKKEFIAAIHAAFERYCVAYQDGAAIKDPEYIFNRSYLVEKKKEPLFDVLVEQLAEKYDEVLTFSYIGPLPAYSFVNIEFSLGNFAVIDRARKTLNLPEKATLKEIKTAYRQLVSTLHPDKCPEDPHAEERFKAIVNAYEILETYYYSCSAQKNVAQYSFAREDVEKLLIVKSVADFG